jgi:hypothetical protein
MRAGIYVIRSTNVQTYDWFRYSFDDRAAPFLNIGLESVFNPNDVLNVFEVFLRLIVSKKIDVIRTVIRQIGIVGKA